MQSCRQKRLNTGTSIAPNQRLSHATRLAPSVTTPVVSRADSRTCRRQGATVPNTARLANGIPTAESAAAPPRAARSRPPIRVPQPERQRALALVTWWTTSSRCFVAARTIRATCSGRALRKRRPKTGASRSLREGPVIFCQVPSILARNSALRAEPPSSTPVSSLRRGARNRLNYS